MTFALPRRSKKGAAMRLLINLLLVAWGLKALAQISPVRVVEKDDEIRACKFVGQIIKSNGLFQTKTANRMLQEALQEAAKAKADTAIVRKSAHSGVTVDVYTCSSASETGGA
jgi:hypothetical protein